METSALVIIQFAFCSDVIILNVASHFGLQLYKIKTLTKNNVLFFVQSDLILSEKILKGHAMYLQLSLYITAVPTLSFAKSEVECRAVGNLWQQETNTSRAKLIPVLDLKIFCSALT